MLESSTTLPPQASREARIASREAGGRNACDHVQRDGAQQSLWLGKNEVMKDREYRELREFQKVFLHRVADSRERAPKGERAQFDCEHWREVKTMTMFAGRWQICVPVHVLGTVASVREEYKTEGGVQVADDAVTQTTTVVIQCHAKPDEIELLYVQKDKGRRRATAADLAGVRHTVAQQQGRLVL